MYQIFSFSEIHEDYEDLFIVYEDYINKALKSTYEGGHFCPARENIFRVFKMPLSEIKVVLLGQDPYITREQATGLSFDVGNSTLQPSLRNIFKKIKGEFPERNYILKSGNLAHWFDQGVFLLNTALTVLLNQSGSLMHLWTDFANATIKYIADYNSDCVFLLMGTYAQSKSKYISNKERIITSIHPSPLSAYKGFFDKKIFTEIEKKVGMIDWETNN